MKYHKYDSKTGMYLETVEAEKQPKNSVGGDLPDQTEYYTIAYLNGEWVSVVRPKYEIRDDVFVDLEKEKQELELEK